jgi:hypothetical protein
MREESKMADSAHDSACSHDSFFSLTRHLLTTSHHYTPVFVRPPPVPLQWNCERDLMSAEMVGAKVLHEASFL